MGLIVSITTYMTALIRLSAIGFDRRCAGRKQHALNWEARALRRDGLCFQWDDRKHRRPLTNLALAKGRVPKPLLLSRRETSQRRHEHDFGTMMARLARRKMSRSGLACQEHFKPRSIPIWVTI